MKIDNYYKPIYLDRTTAIALLVRLENGDIPYPHSKNVLLYNCQQNRQHLWLLLFPFISSFSYKEEV